MYRAIALLIFISFFTPPNAIGGDRGESGEELFSLANLAYLDGRYEEAIENYKAIEKKGIINPDVYYNLGNTYAKLGELGKARLYYEKSLELYPDGEDIRHNLDIVKKNLSIPADKLDVRPPWERLSGFITFRGSANLTIFFYLTTFLILIIFKLTESEDRRKKIRTVTIAFVILTVTGGSVTLLKLSQQEGENLGIIRIEKADIYEAPIERGKPIKSLAEGIKVKIVESEKNWLKVSTSEGVVGWIRKKEVGII